MSEQCIPANPDISGIGVRIAIYAQNLFCFAPVVAHLWDGTVSKSEIKGVKDQSIGMLCIAFAILISTVVQAKEKTTGNNDNLISSYQAAIILNLSWMNNTSTFIWFLLYAHQRSKPEADKHHRALEAVEATWTAWFEVLREALRQVADEGDSEPAPVYQRRRRSLSQRLSRIVIQIPSQLRSLRQWCWNLVTLAPVLTFGSLHLTLMAALGIWLWSDPSKFGTRLSCDPSLAIVGAPVAFSSQTLRICSIIIYSFFLVPGLNLLIPFAFFLSLHILYNWSRRYRSIQRQRIRDQEANIPMIARTSTTANNVTASKGPIHTTFLLVGLVCLFVVNVIFLADTELTLARNKHIQNSGEGEWGFGQILSLLLLVVPLRDFWNSIVDIREKRASQDLEEMLTLGSFPEDLRVRKLLRRGADPNMHFKNEKLGVATVLQLAAYEGREKLLNYLLNNGAQVNPQVTSWGTALNCAAAEGHLSCAEFLLDRGADPRVMGVECGNAIRAALRGWHVGIAFILLEHSGNERYIEMLNRFDTDNVLEDSRLDICNAAVRQISNLHDVSAKVKQKYTPVIVKALKGEDRDLLKATLRCLPLVTDKTELHEDIQISLSSVADYLKLDGSDVRQAAVEALSALAMHTELHDEIRTIIPEITMRLKDSNWKLRIAVVKALSELAEHTELRDEIRRVIPDITLCLKNKDADEYEYVRRAAIEALSSLAEHTELHEEIRRTIPDITTCSKEWDSDVGPAAVEALSGFAGHAELREEIRRTIPDITMCLGNWNWDVRQAAVKALSVIAEHTELREEIRRAIPDITMYLKDSDWDARRAAVKALSGLAEHTELLEEIRGTIPIIMMWLKDSDWSARRAAVNALPGLAGHAEMREKIRRTIPNIMICLKDSDEDVRQAAVEALSGLAAHAELREEIRHSIPYITMCLKDSDWSVRRAAVEALSGLAGHTELHEEIGKIIPDITMCLKDSDSDVRKAAIEAVSALAKHTESREEIRRTIPAIALCLKDSDSGVRRAAVEALSGLAKHTELREAIRGTIPALAIHLKNEDRNVRRAAVEALSGLAKHTELQGDIRKTIPRIADCLRHDDEDVRQAAIDTLSELAIYDVFREEMKLICFLLYECINSSETVEPLFFDCLLAIVIRWT